MSIHIDRRGQIVSLYSVGDPVLLPDDLEIPRALRTAGNAALKSGEAVAVALDEWTLAHAQLAQPNPRPAEDAAEWVAFDNLTAVQASSETILAKYAAALTEWLDTDEGAQALGEYEASKVAAYRVADAKARAARDLADLAAREVGEVHRTAYSWTHDRYDFTDMPTALRTGMDASSATHVDQVEAFWQDVAAGGDGRVPAAGFSTPIRIDGPVRNPRARVVVV